MVIFYREKRKVAVKVLQWTGENKDELKRFCGKYIRFFTLQSEDGTKTKELCVLKPRSIVFENDYIIRDSHGCFTVCDQEYLDRHYERTNFQWWNTK
jgi:hypothetical protein